MLSLRCARWLAGLLVLPVVIACSNGTGSVEDPPPAQGAQDGFTIGGNVVLSQGLNTIRGDRLVIDLKTGLSRFENSTETADGATPKQRLRAIFSPNAKAAPEN